MDLLHAWLLFKPHINDNYVNIVITVFIITIIVRKNIKSIAHCFVLWKQGVPTNIKKHTHCNIEGDKFLCKNNSYNFIPVLGVGIPQILKWEEGSNDSEFGRGFHDFYFFL